MAGVILDLLPMTRLDFTQVTAGQTQRQQLTPRPIDVSAYTEGTLLVRVHSLTISASHTIVVKAVLVAPTDEDPAMLFWLPDAPVASVTIDTSTTAPSAEQGTLLKGVLSASFGAALVIVVEGYRPAAGAADLKATISVAMSLKGLPQPALTMDMDEVDRGVSRLVVRTPIRAVATAQKATDASPHPNRKPAEGLLLTAAPYAVLETTTLKATETISPHEPRYAVVRSGERVLDELSMDLVTKISILG